MAFEVVPGISCFQLKGASPAMSSTEVSVSLRRCCCEVKEDVSKASSWKDAKLVGTVDPDAGEDGSMDGEDGWEGMGERAGSLDPALSFLSPAPPSRCRRRTESAGGWCPRCSVVVASNEVDLSQRLMRVVSWCRQPP